MNPDPILSRRSALVVGAAGAGAVALAACGSSGAKKSPLATSSPARATAPTPASSAPSPSEHSSASGPALAKLGDIAVGSAVSAKLADGSPVVVARPAAAKVACFSAICTHRGCTVAPAGTELHCPCHGSVFDATTGQVINGPAQRPLEAVNVHLVDGTVVAD